MFTRAPLILRIDNVCAENLDSLTMNSLLIKSSFPILSIVANLFSQLFHFLSKFFYKSSEMKFFILVF